MTMILTDQQRQIVEHFASYLPLMKRELFATFVIDALKDRHDDDSGQGTTRACIDAVNAMAVKTNKEKNNRINVL
jgi:hypothetical protein